MSFIGALYAENVAITPYMANVKYDQDSSKSLKDSSQYNGIKVDFGDSDYLVEFNYNLMDIKYKDENLTNLKQHDVTLAYNALYKNHATRVGIHYINNSEKESFRDLGSGIVGIVGAQWFGFMDKDKMTFGANGYYSVYPKAYDNVNTSKTKIIDIVQFSPYLIYSKLINANAKNDLSLRANIISASQYADRGYVSYEISDTLVYKDYYVVLKYFGGELKSAVVDDGMTVYNTKDLITGVYSAKVGFYPIKNFAIDVSYFLENNQEYNAITVTLEDEGTRDAFLASISYSF